MICLLVKPRGRKEIIMNKIEAYKEVFNLVEMVECILSKFHADMAECHIADDIFCCYNGYFTVHHPTEGFIKSNNAILVSENGEYVMHMLSILNKYEDFGWNPYLTALGLGIEKIFNLMHEYEE